MPIDGTNESGASARWNVASVCIPLAGFLFAVAVGAGGNGFLWDGHPMDGVVWGFRVWFGFCTMGVLAALVALVRKERLWGLTVLGLILNLPALGLSSLYLSGR